MQNVIFTKYSNDRDAKFNIVTEIVVNDLGEKSVVKRPFTAAAKEHVSRIAENCEILKRQYQGTAVEIADAVEDGDSVRITWVEGEAFSERLDELLSQGKREEWIRQIKVYFENMFAHKKEQFIKTADFEEIFGDVELSSEESAISNIDIDMLFSNVFYKDGKWSIYDYEWAVTFDVPIKFLIYRCFRYYTGTQTRSMMSLDDIYEEFDITKDQLQIYDQMENRFQKYIEGSQVPMWRLYRDIHGEVVDIQSLQERHVIRHRAQLFYDFGEGYSEENSKVLVISPEKGNHYCVQLTVPLKTVRLRFDPISNACVMGNIRIVDEDGNAIKYETNGRKMDADTFAFLHGDPQIIVKKNFSGGAIQVDYVLQVLDGSDEDVFVRVEQFAAEQEREKNECVELLHRKENEYRQEIQKKESEQRQCEKEFTVQMRKKEDDLIQSQQAIEMLKNSISWRITKPLRIAKGKLFVLKNALRRSEEHPEVVADETEVPEELLDEEQNVYETWITEVEKGYEKIRVEDLAYQPKISILVPVYNVLDRHLIPCIESVIQQDYPNWELCLADDCSTWPNVREALEKYRSHEKIQVVYRTENGHISECTNSALHIATGDFVALLDCDDLLAPNALSEVVKLLNEDPTLDFIYSDEDKIDDDGGNRHMPHFKSDWAPDTLMSHMYTCHLGVYRRIIALEIGGERKGYEGAQDYDFTLRFTEKTDRIAHIPKILYHWRERKESTAGNPEAKPYILEAARKSKEDALKRRGLNAQLELVDGIFQYRANYVWDKYPKISVIIPSKDNYDYLNRCLKTFTEITVYEDYEFIIVDNGSKEENKKKYEELAERYQAKYIYERKEFNFSYMCNLGAKHAKGEFLLFLNDDIEIINAEWLTRMAGQAMLSHTGAVGAKLLYPDKKSIQHVGVINIKNGPVHAFVGFQDDFVYYFGRNAIDYNQLAVTAACLLVNRKKFEEIGGFEEELAVTYNDTDFCFKLVEKGYYNIVRNDAVLIHHESVSRGNDALNREKMQRLEQEREKLYARHPEFRDRDPFYNPNLSQCSDDFGYNFGASMENYTKLERIKKPVYDPRGVSYSVDEINTKGIDVCIRGWALVDGKDIRNFRDISILLKNEAGDWWKGNAFRVERRDVDEALGGNGRYRFAGFFSRIKGEDIPMGIYTIGVVMNGKGIMTEKKLECQ